MKKTNKIVLIVVLVLVVAFGVGQFFAYSNLSSVNPSGGNSTSSQSGASTEPATQIVYYMPPPLASSTPVEKGSCWTNSIAAPYRADAWRCAVGNGISDPCFQMAGSTSTLLCGVNPADPETSSTFALKLTQPLPTPEVLPSSTPSGMAWLVELQDGTLCTPFTGTLPPVMDGSSTANYACAPGPLGVETVIFGNLDTIAAAWTADVGSLSTATSTFQPVIVSSSSVPVAEVWE